MPICSGESEPDDDVSAALAEAVKSGLAVAVGAGRYRFSHDLVREALYEEIEPTERWRSIGRSPMRSSNCSRLAGQSCGRACLPLLRRGRRWLGSITQGTTSEQSPGKPRPYARLAADQAAAALAYEEASRLYQRAIDALELTEEPDDLNESTCC